MVTENGYCLERAVCGEACPDVAQHTCDICTCTICKVCILCTISEIYVYVIICRYIPLYTYI